MKIISALFPVLPLTLIVGLAAACSRDMAEQPSYRPQEAPRKNSAPHSIPRASRKMLPALASLAGTDLISESGRLFAINCVHCHGPAGRGDGPVAGYLKETPEDLRSGEVQGKSERKLYDIITEGLDGMPAFRGHLSAEERLLLARYVHSLETRTASVK